MDEVRQRQVNFRKLKALLILVRDHANNPMTYDFAMTYMERAEEAMTECKKYHSKLIDLCADDSAITIQEATFTNIEDTYVEIRSTLRGIIRSLGPSGITTPSTPANINIKLPAIELPKFDGNFANWPSFKDLFQATVDSNAQLAPSQKLQYLKSALLSEPATLINPITITDAHYKEAWDILKDRYDNTREIVFSLVNKLINIKALQTESPSELQRLIDNSTECIRALKVLKQPTEHWDSILVVVYTSKLDASTRREWAIRQTSTNLPTFKDFHSFVTSHIRGLLATGTNSTASTTKKRDIRSHYSTTESNCQVCKGSHSIYKCQDFLSKPPSERSAMTKRLHLCFNCLGKDHRLTDCPSKKTCRKCSRKHNSLLHEDRIGNPVYQPPRADPPRTNPQPVPAPPQPLNSNHVSVETQVLLATAIVRVKDCHGQLCRAFLDSGSQGTFITEDCSRRLGLKRDHSRLTVTGVSSSSAGTTRGKVHVTMYNHSTTDSINIQAHVMSRVTGDLPKLKCKKEKWLHLHGIQLADPDYHEPGPIDFLIGADYVAELMRSGRKAGPDTAPIAQETLFGWVLSGRVAIASNVSILSFHTGMNTDDLLRRFWEIEEPPKVRFLTNEEKLCEQHFVDNYSRDENGRYIVGIPFNKKKEELGASRAAAVKRLLQVERRLQRIPHCKQQYADFMKEYWSLGHMVKLPPAESFEAIGNTNYLPHHFVVNESSSTTKLRVVFDGSARTSTGVSFNDTLMVGATIQDDLYDILLRFRIHAVVIKGDITKMFRQFRLRDQDTEFHRIVWRNSPDEPIQDYRLVTVTYGTAYAPFLATRCLQQVGNDCEKTLPEAASTLKRDAYVDDIMSGKDSTTEAIKLYKELTQAVGQAGMELRKWSSNDPNVLSIIPDAFQETSPSNLDPDQSIKALGVQWNPSTDHFTFKYVCPKKSDLLTKRVLLSELSRVYDPLGLISAVTVRAKLLLQELWRLAIDWDDTVPDTVLKQWEEYQEDLQQIPAVRIPRRITHNGVTSYQLHGFADASERAYGAVIYLRSVTAGQTVLVSFVTSKTRVSPLKQISLPRLELIAAVLLSELIVHVKETLQLDSDLYCWSDSTITIRWIASQPRRWKTFVANRVAKIQELTPIECWRHVPGVQNPADLASRGVQVSELIQHDFWWKGPSWLSEPIIPIFVHAIDENNHDQLEERLLPTLVHYTETPDIAIIERFSSLTRLQRVIGWMLRLTKIQQQKMPGPLRASELRDALIKCVKLVQQQCFASEVHSLQNGKQLPPKSKLCSLYPYLDSVGVLRVTGRLQQSQISENRKHQMILPRNHHLTSLIVQHFHTKYLHSGFQSTWSAIQSEFWIPGGRDKVRHLIRSCVVCKKQRSEAAEQLMGNLPSSRVTPTRAFLHTGVDYAGPFQLKNPIGRGAKTYKGYLCVFVCMATKAVHLEAVSSLSTEAFIATLRRFVARRGFCANLYSDYGRNFVGAEKELQNFINSRDVNCSINDNASVAGITWHFNPPSAPHHGGLWESAVKSAKHHLRRVIGNALLTFEQFQTILCQIEAVLNSRPLYPSSSDSSDVSALTPGHFLIGEPLMAVPDADVTDIPSGRLQQYQLQQQRVQHFWRRWKSEYLNTLQQRRKWMWERDNVKIGDLVLIKEDNSSPGQWKMARVVAVHPGADNRVRVATVKTPDSEYLRPIAKLIPLINSEN